MHERATTSSTTNLAAKHRVVRVAIVGLLMVAIAGVAAWFFQDTIAVMMAPRKEPVKTRTAAAREADELFWTVFHGGEYDKIPNALEVLTAAYLETPNDPVTAAHIGWLHSWRLSEIARVASPPATITDNAALSRHYFHEAVMLDPSDARYLGFLAAMTMVEANIDKDQRLTREGYFMLQRAIRDWPEFNLFTGGYIMSRLPANTPQFQEGLEWQWQNLCECASEPVDRADPDWSKYMPQETTEGRKRVCWNSWIAPHNFEGFFLNMGDMLVKSGDWRTAKKIYANAKLSKDYEAWKFRTVLEERIDHAEANVAVFNDTSKTPSLRMMIDSEFACMACHQKQ